MKKLLVTFLILSAIACSKKSGPGPTAETERYYKAIDAGFNGDSRAGYDELLQLAIDAPDTRAGRKARAVLQSDDPIAYVAAAGVVSAVLIPSFAKNRESAFAPPARSQVGRDVAIAFYERQFGYFAQFGKYEAKPMYAHDLSSKYSIIYGPKSVDLAMERVPGEHKEQIAKAQRLLAKLNLKPNITKKSFLIAVVGEPNEDGMLDLWTIDNDRNIMHLADFEE